MWTASKSKGFKVIPPLKGDRRCAFLLSMGVISDITHRNLLFVSGKGGVGKTAISQAIALALSKKGKKTLWVCFEDPLRPEGELKQINSHLWHLNCDPTQAFEEYAAMKIGAARLAKIFVQNKLMRYLAQAAPGIHELVLLGKVWFERKNFDHVVVDMPSTGYGLAMFQSVANFARLFIGGPIHRDAEEMLQTFRDPQLAGTLILSLPEEMPLRESIELNDFLNAIFPDNPSGFMINRRFPKVAQTNDAPSENPDQWPNPVPKDTQDYITKRVLLEKFNLKLWDETPATQNYGELSFIPPPAENPFPQIRDHLAQELIDKGYV